MAELQIIDYILNDPIGAVVEIIVLGCVFAGIGVLIRKCYRYFKKRKPNGSSL